MKVLIVDDEKLARTRLVELIEKIGGHQVVGEASSGSDAISKAMTSKPDIILMDIRMPGMDGLEAALHLSSSETPPAIIFITAYDQYALDAFEANAVDYLLKPIRRERLAAALEKAQRFSAQTMRQVTQSQPVSRSRTHISVHMRGQINLIPLSDIIYFMADNKYVVVRTSSEQHLIEDSLVSLEEEFQDSFIRVHRNALVATSWIKGMERQSNGRWQVILNQIDDQLDVSRRHTPALRRWARQ